MRIPLNRMSELHEVEKISFAYIDRAYSLAYYFPVRHNPDRISRLLLDFKAGKEEATEFWTKILGCSLEEPQKKILLLHSLSSEATMNVKGSPLDLLCRAIVERVAGVTYCPQVIKKSRRTKPLKCLWGRKERQEELRDVYQFIPPTVIPETDAVVIIIDDVVCMGATSEAIAKAIKSKWHIGVFLIALCQETHDEHHRVVNAMLCLKNLNKDAVSELGRPAPQDASAEVSKKDYSHESDLPVNISLAKDVSRSIPWVFVDGGDQMESFYIDAIPVVFAQYDMFCYATGRRKPWDEGWGRGAKPVINVSWDDVQAFCAWISDLTGEAIRLPREDEWEYAAQGGISNSGFLYSGSDLLDDVGWYNENSDHQTHDVAQKQPNKLGLYDMSGNVWEWCQRKSGAEEGWQALRGGAWSTSAQGSQIVRRYPMAAHHRNSNCGFRLVAEINDKSH